MMSYASSFDPDNVALRHPVYSGLVFALFIVVVVVVLVVVVVVVVVVFVVVLVVHRVQKKEASSFSTISLAFLDRFS